MDISRFLAALVVRMARKGEVKLLGLCIMCAYVSVMCLCIVRATLGSSLLLCILFSETHALTAPDSDRLAGQQAPGVLLSLLQCWDCRHVLLVQSMGLRT